MALRQPARDFLKNAERAQPATEYAAAPQQRTGQHEQPQQVHHRIDQIGLQTKPVNHAAHDGKHVDDG